MDASGRSGMHVPDAERAILGGIFLESAKLLDVADIVRAEDFGVGAHRLVFGAMVRLVDRQQPIDIVTIAAELGADLERAGGMGALAGFDADVPAISNLAHYATIVHDAAVRRRMLAVGAQVQALARDQDQRTADVVAQAEAAVLGIAQDLGAGRETETIADALRNEVWPALEARAAKGGMRGIPTGFTDLDRRMSGLQAGDLIIIGGRPSMGKTSLAMNIAANVAASTGPVLVFSLEMDRAALIDRLLGCLGRVDSDHVRNASLSTDEWTRLAQAADELAKLPLAIRDDPGLKPIDIRSIARRARKRLGGLALVVVDYIQMLEAPGADSREQDVAAISRSMKMLARELDLPVIALAQLSRALEKRPDKHPQLSDLRESGALEQDADVVLGVYRDEKYNEKSKDVGIAEVIVLKQRNGSIGTVRTAFLEKFMRFENLADAEQPPDRPRQADFMEDR